MKVHILPDDLKSKLLFVTAIILLVANPGCSTFPPPEELVPVDETYEGISLQEAQEIAPFPICLPVHVPDGIEATPHTVYHADFGDPMESDVRLHYYSSASRELIVEVYQRHRPGAATPEKLDEGVRDFYERDLLAWQVGWLKADQVRGQVTINVTEYQNNNMRYWLFEIVEPTSLQANMIAWGNDPVAYQVYTHLSIDQAKRIVQSIPYPPDCGE